jgi:hypothetical protein
LSLVPVSFLKYFSQLYFFIDKQAAVMRDRHCPVKKTQGGYNGQETTNKSTKCGPKKPASQTAAITAAAKQKQSSSAEKAWI